MTETCSSCGFPTLLEREMPFDFLHEGQSLSIIDKQTYCANCGNVSYIGGQIAAHQFAVAEKIRSLEGLLSPNDLLRIRSRYKFSQTEMERLLAIGPKTWTRWERGKIVQAKATDMAVRRMDEDPRFVAHLMRLHQVDNPESFALIAQSKTRAIRHAAFELARWLTHSAGALNLVAAASAVIDTFEFALKESRAILLHDDDHVNLGQSFLGAETPLTINVFSSFSATPSSYVSLQTEQRSPSYYGNQRLPQVARYWSGPSHVLQKVVIQ